MYEHIVNDTMIYTTYDLKNTYDNMHMRLTYDNKESF